MRVRNKCKVLDWPKSAEELGIFTALDLGLRWVLCSLSLKLLFGHVLVLNAASYPSRCHQEPYFESVVILSMVQSVFHS